jgi:guanine nucleotide-binding protein subunit alpha
VSLRIHCILPSPFFTYELFTTFRLGLSHTGQAESGKSTILRNFQLKYAPTAFHAEAEAWRAAIDLNLVRSVTFLLNLLEESSPIASNSTTDAASGGGGGSSSVDTGPPGDLRRLRVRLSPLRSIEGSLARSISPEHYPWPVGSVGSSSNSSKARGQGFEEVQRNARRVIEACREDIVALWNYPAVHASFADQSVSLECQSGLCVATDLYSFHL